MSLIRYGSVAVLDNETSRYKVALTRYAITVIDTYMNVSLNTYFVLWYLHYRSGGNRLTFIVNGTFFDINCPSAAWRSGSTSKLLRVHPIPSTVA